MTAENQGVGSEVVPKETPEFGFVQKNLEIYEDMFKNRYKDLDEDYQATVAKTLAEPPCVESWFSKPKRNDWSRGGGRYGNRQGDRNFQGHKGSYHQNRHDSGHYNQRYNDRNRNRGNYQRHDQYRDRSRDRDRGNNSSWD